MAVTVSTTRDRYIVVAGVACLAALAWFDLVRRANGMTPGMSMGTDPMTGMAMAMAMPMSTPWNVSVWTAAVLMWSVMMVAMMLPSTTPMLLLFSGVQRARRTAGDPALPTGLFAAGYLGVWVAWSVLAAGLQWILQSLLLLSPQLAVTRVVLAATFLLLAGLYQLTPVKYACLARCQTPLGFLLTQWREGPGGALRMGARYGATCAGCCWALMGLLFVGGVKNLLWVAAVAVFVLAEKVTRGPWLARGAGGAFIGWALYVLRAGLTG